MGVAARLECQVQRSAACLFAGCCESKDFGVRFAGAVMIPLPDDAAFRDDDCPDHRIRAGTPPAFRRKTERVGHVEAVTIGGIHRVLRDGDLSRTARADRAPFADRDRAFAVAFFFPRGEAEAFDVGDFFFPVGIALSAACAAASLAIGTRNGEQLT